MTQIRCKVECECVTMFKDGSEVTFKHVTSGSPENESFFRWTPYGEIKLGLVNKDTAEQFKPGKQYYLDFTPA